MAEVKRASQPANLPVTARGVGEYLERLQHALAVARASRAAAAATLSRLRAVANFNGNSPKSCRSDKFLADR